MRIKARVQKQKQQLQLNVNNCLTEILFVKKIGALISQEN